MPSRRREDDDKNEEKRLDEKGHKMDKLSHDDEVRRILKWLSFARPKVVFGFDHLSPAFVPTMATKTRGMAFCFERISGWRCNFKHFQIGDFTIFMIFTGHPPYL